MWRELPIYTEAEASDYAEECAQRWCAAVRLGRPLTRDEWQAVNPPNMLHIPGAFWEVVHAVFVQRCGLRADAACLRWWDWHQQWFGRPCTWIERLEAELREYDEVLAELTEDELRGETESSRDGPSRGW